MSSCDAFSRPYLLLLLLFLFLLFFIILTGKPNIDRLIRTRLIYRWCRRLCIHIINIYIFIIYWQHGIQYNIISSFWVFMKGIPQERKCAAVLTLWSAEVYVGLPYISRGYTLEISHAVGILKIMKHKNKIITKYLIILKNIT